MIPGLYHDYNRKTALAVQETGANVEYVQLQGSLVDLFTMAGDNFFSAFREVSSTKPVAELAKNMLELGNGIKMTERAKSALISLMQAAPEPVMEPVVENSAQALCEAALLPFDADPVAPVEKPKRHRRTKEEIEAAKAAKLEEVKTIAASGASLYVATEVVSGDFPPMIVSRVPSTTPGIITKSGSEPELPATLDTPEKVSEWKAARLQEIHAEIERVKAKKDVALAYRLALAEIEEARAVLAALRLELA